MRVKWIVLVVIWLYWLSLPFWPLFLRVAGMTAKEHPVLQQVLHAYYAPMFYISWHVPSLLGPSITTIYNAPLIAIALGAVASTAAWGLGVGIAKAIRRRSQPR